MNSKTLDLTCHFLNRAMLEYLPVCSGLEAWPPRKSDAVEHRHTRSASLLWFLLQWYSLISCERLPSRLSYSHWCLSSEPRTWTPWTSLHLGPQRQSHRPVNLAAHPVSSTRPSPPISPRSKPKNELSSPPLSWTCHLEIRSRVPVWGGWGTQRLNIGEVCPREGVCDRNLLIFTGWYNPSPLCI